jgi:large subunit ribosomal protein L25
MTVTLNATPRSGEKSAKALLRNGFLPGVVYGPQQPATAIALSKKEFDKIFKTAGESTIIELSGLGRPFSVLVKEVDFAPTKGGVRHVDFYAVDMTQEITASVPLHFVGEVPAEKAGGVVNRVLHEIEVTCMPKDLPSHIDVDVSGLQNIDDQLHVSDLVIPKDVTVETGLEEVVIVVGEPAKEEEPAAVEAVDMSTIEVEKKGKAEEAVPAE